MRVLASILLLLGAACAQAQPLDAAELAALAAFDGRGGDEARADARRLFAGKGARVAAHYLAHTGVPPRPGAYFVALPALGDPAAAQVLIRGLLDNGPRYEGEIAALLDEVLRHDALSADPAIAVALVQAAEALRARPRGIALGTAMLAVELLGRLRSEEARAALRSLAAVPQLRDTALAALGGAGAAGDAGVLGGALRDPKASTRAEAARSLARLKPPDALPELERALAAERDPQVVDALIGALAGYGALPREPARCLELAGRASDAQPAAAALACWRGQASPAALVEAALDAPPTVRAIALAALFERPRGGERMLVRPPAARVAAPPAPPGAAPATAVIPPQAPPASVPGAELDAPTRARLLASAAQALSSRLSHTLVYQTQELLLDIAQGDMRLALRHADAIRTPHARSSNEGRLAASQALARRDPGAYSSARRPPQALLAAALGALALLLAALRPAGPALAAAASLPFFAWAIATLFTASARELPPLALAPLTVAGSAAIASAAVATAVALARGRGIASGRLAAVALGAGAIAAAAVLAFVICAAARWYGFFPTGVEGWEGIFEPLAAALVAVPLAFLALAASAALRRFYRA